MARLILCFYILFLCKCINSTIDIQPDLTKNKENPVVSKEEQKTEVKQKSEEIPVIKIDTKETKGKNIDLGKVDDNKNKVSSTDNVSISKIASNTSTNKNNDAESEIESGAVMRGIYVFVGITLLFIMYIAFKTYRRGNRKNVIIKKYGVRTKRSDLEMEPLPLDEDEEDETVFDLGNVNNR